MKPFDTIREALDAADDDLGDIETQMGSVWAIRFDRARAALDSLEAELNAADLSLAAMLQDIGKRDDLIGELRARNDGMADRLGWARRLAPVDSPPGDEELRRLRAAIDAVSDVSPEPGLFDETCLVLEAAEAHLRSQQPETEEQRAPLEEIETLRSYIEGQLSAFALSYNHHASDALSAMEAYIRHRTGLAKARDAEGGK